MKAFIDFLGVTFRTNTTNPETVREWIEHVTRLMFGDDVNIIETGRGWSGYRCRLDLEGIGLVAYHGNGNTIHFEVTGTGCAQVKDWQDFADIIEQSEGKLTRVDVAADDLDGDQYSIEWAKAAYKADGFKPERGASPKAQLVDDMGSGKGCTFYVGSRESGKLYRGYEKGKQLGDPQSPWFRNEVEYRAVHRELPLQMLRDPGAYLAGAYPCLADISDTQSRPRTVAFEAAAKIGKTLDHAKKQAGRAIHMVLTLNGGDIADALARIHVPELPRRLVGSVRTLLTVRDAEATHTTCRPPDFMRDCTPAEAIALSRAHTRESYEWRTRYRHTARAVPA